MKKISKRLNIFLVDDDPDDRYLFSEAIAEVVESYELQLFCDGSEIIDYLKKKPTDEELPDIIFMDINMPHINGLAALQLIRNELRMNSLPIAMYSTSSAEANIEESLSLGANIYITKPASFDKLKELLHKALNSNIQFSTSTLRMDTFVLAL